MRSTIAAIVLFTPAFTAGAQELSPSFDQSYDNDQTVEQVFDAGMGSASSLAEMTDTAGVSAPDLSQTGANFVNLVFSGDDLSTVRQWFDGRQQIDNTIVSGAIQVLGAIEQSGNNLAGAITGNTIDLADQFMGQNGLQRVNNSAILGAHFQSISQSGNNIANLAVADYAIGTASQQMEAGAQQIVENTLALTASAVVGEFISQAGANYGNILVTDRIDSVSRVFAADQIVNNTVYLESLDTIPTINQSGINVANLIMANEIGAIHQESIGSQVVKNRVYGPDGEILTGPTIQQTEENSMGPSSHIVNLAIIGPREGSSDNGEMSISQNSDFSQESHGSDSNSQAGNVVSITR